MKLTIPTWLTLLRIVLIPVLVFVFYLPYSWSNFAAVFVFVFAALTGWTALIALFAVLLLIDPLRRVLGGANGPRLIPVIQSTGFAEIGVGLGLLVGIYLG